MIDELLKLVPASLHGRSGRVFYSGPSAFAKPNDIYVLGLNPGGCPIKQAVETVGADIASSRQRGDWSAYRDESWGGRAPGTAKMQPRVLHLFRKLRREPHTVPASNVVFVRSTREQDLQSEKAGLLKACWPVHQKVIDELSIKFVISFGNTAGDWVRREMDAHDPIGYFEEQNDRRWRSSAHKGRDGRHVVTVTHPGIAKWDEPKTDPTNWILQLIADAKTTKRGWWRL